MLDICRRAKAKFVVTGITISLKIISLVIERLPHTYDKVMYRVFGWESRLVVFSHIELGYPDGQTPLES